MNARAADVAAANADAAALDCAHAGATTRVATLDWPRIARDLDTQGHAIVERLLSADACQALAGLYARDDIFRSRVIMARHGFGRGEYRYFAYPLPPLVAALRAAFYRELVPVANRWNVALKNEARFPDEHDAYLERCRAAGQMRPTPLLLRYGAGDYNCLHQDLYGAEAFPLQVVILLSEPGADFEGGEFVMTEQRPRMQSRPMVVPLQRGDAAIIAVNERPVQGTRGTYRVKLRHGVSRLVRGERYTAGIVFHDAA